MGQGRRTGHPPTRRGGWWGSVAVVPVPAGTGLPPGIHKLPVAARSPCLSSGPRWLYLSARILYLRTK